MFKNSWFDNEVHFLKGGNFAAGIFVLAHLVVMNHNFTFFGVPPRSDSVTSSGCPVYFDS